MLIDKVRINLKAGKGGDGGIDFEKTGKPAGGNGGRGGKIFLVGDHNVYDLSSFTEKYNIEAENGQQGGKNKRQGKDGQDIYLKVPIVTTLLDIDENVIATVESNGQTIPVAMGGIGGLGNHYFRSGQVATLRKTTPGKPGDVVTGFLKFELVADIVFFGLPNAGKSTLLNSLTNAIAKVAAYPFTTLEPNLGKFHQYLMIDLPGLIEGAKEGKGLGKRFMRHTKKAKLLVHAISAESLDLISDYNIIRTEISGIAPHLVDCKELILLTKSDILSKTEIDEKTKLLSQMNNNIIDVCAYNPESIKTLEQKILNIITKQ
jgi:GTPase